MTLDEAMHAECAMCGEMAMNHRMTDSGNFYCLRFINHYQQQNSTKQVAMRAPCNELRKSPLSKVKEVGTTIMEQWRTLSPSVGEQLSL